MQFGSYVQVPINKCWPTYSALPVNTKEVSSDVRFRRKLLFHCCSMILDFRCSSTCSRSSDSELCSLSIFTHHCVYLVFRYSLIKFAWDGSSHFTMSMHTPLTFIKQIPRLNNSFDVMDCCVVVWLSLKIYLFGCVG